MLILQAPAVMPSSRYIENVGFCGFWRLVSPALLLETHLLCPTSHPKRLPWPQNTCACLMCIRLRGADDLELVLETDLHWKCTPSSHVVSSIVLGIIGVSWCVFDWSYGLLWYDAYLCRWSGAHMETKVLPHDSPLVLSRIFHSDSRHLHWLLSFEESIPVATGLRDYHGL